MGRPILLDLEKNSLFGWEHEKTDKVIDAIIRGIEAGDTFPNVKIFRGRGFGRFPTGLCLYPSFETKIPLLDDSELVFDGGHSRAVAHYIMGVPLRCELVRLQLESLPLRVTEGYVRWIDIKEIKIVDDKGEYESGKNRVGYYR